MINKTDSYIETMCLFLNMFNKNNRYNILMVRNIFLTDAVIARGLIGFCLQHHTETESIEALQDLYSFYEEEPELGLIKFFKSLNIAFNELSAHIKNLDDTLKFKRIRELFPD